MAAILGDDQHVSVRAAFDAARVDGEHSGAGLVDPARVRQDERLDGAGAERHRDVVVDLFELECAGQARFVDAVSVHELCVRPMGQRLTLQPWDTRGLRHGGRPLGVGHRFVEHASCRCAFREGAHALGEGEVQQRLNEDGRDVLRVVYGAGEQFHRGDEVVVVDADGGEQVQGDAAQHPRS
jgi:hypothetical protein